MVPINEEVESAAGVKAADKRRESLRERVEAAQDKLETVDGKMFNLCEMLTLFKLNFSKSDESDMLACFLKHLIDSISDMRAILDDATGAVMHIADRET